MVKQLYHYIRKVEGTREEIKDAQGPIQKSNIIVSEPFSSPNWIMIEFLKAIGRTHEEFKDFHTSLIGTIVTPFDSDYKAARLDSDIAFHRYPYLIVYCNGIADVQKTVLFSLPSPSRPNRQRIPIIPRGGGHSTEGYSTIQQGIVIDVSKMDGIAVENNNKNEYNSPYALVGAGTKWAKAYQEVQAYDLHVVGGDCDSVGVAGFTMGGGYSKTSIKHGMGSDNILYIKMVDVEGNIVEADSKTNSKLYWAVRGGTGGQFGIVVEFKLKLYPILPKVYKIAINWPIEKAAQVLYNWQTYLTQSIKPAHEDLGILGFLYFSSEGVREDAPKRAAKAFFTIRGVWLNQDVKLGKEALEPLLKVPGWFTPTPGGDIFDPKNLQPYPYLSTHLLDDVEGRIPSYCLETKRCAYVEKKLQVADYQVMVDYFQTSPSEYNIVSMEPYGGAISRVPADATAFVHRSAYFDIFVDSFWVDKSQQEDAVKWLKDYYEGPKTKYLWSNHYYQNYVNSDYKNWQEGYFSTNYQELQYVKYVWDKNEILKYPQSITPAKPTKGFPDSKTILVYADRSQAAKETKDGKEVESDDSGKESKEKKVSKKRSPQEKAKKGDGEKSTKKTKVERG